MNNKTSIQIQSWVRQLRSGDHVIYENPITRNRTRTKVIDVSPRGVITTALGKFKYPDIGDKVVGYGGTMGWLFPEDDIFSITAIPSTMTRTAKKKEAKLFCAAVVKGDVELSYGLIEELLQIKRRHAREA